MNKNNAAQNAGRQWIYPVLERISLVCTAALFTITILSFFLPTHVNLLSIVCSLVLCAASLFFSYHSSYMLEEEGKKRLFLACKINLVLVAINFFFLPTYRAFTLSKSTAALFLSAIALILITVGSYAAFTGTLNLSLEKSLTKILSETPDLPVISSGDVVLCENKDEVECGGKDPRVVISFKDRFLHMLILGPTGCGKTSQVLLPMIYQDLQNPASGVIVMEPKGDLAQQVFFLARNLDRPVKYFDPSVDNCPHFNPLMGKELDVLETIAQTFKMMQADSSEYFQGMADQLVRNSVKVLKRLDEYTNNDGKYANFITFSCLVQNPGGDGRELIELFTKLTVRNALLTDEQKNENEEIAEYFKTDYYAERSKTYENTSSVRSQLTKLCSNDQLRDVLNPNVEKNETSEIDFAKALEDGDVICISTAQGPLKDLSKFLGYFLILQLQAAVFNRPGNENTRRACFLYIDEFQTYANPGFNNMLTQGRSYRVATHLSTQSLASMEMGCGRDGRAFVESVKTNARNLVVFPGINFEDASYFSKQFGEYNATETSKSVSQKKPTSWMDVAFGCAGPVTESIHEAEKVRRYFSPTDIMQQPFGQVVYSIVKDKSVQRAHYGLLKFLPITSDAQFEKDIAEYFSEHERKAKAVVAESAPVATPEPQEEEQPSKPPEEGGSVLWNRLEAAALEQQQEKSSSTIDTSWFN